MRMRLLCTVICLLLRLRCALRCGAERARVFCVSRALRAAAPRSYLADDRELRRWCASMHLLGTLPHCIAVDDLSQLVDARCESEHSACAFACLV